MPARDDLFSFDHFINAVLVTGVAALALVLVPTWIAVPVLVALAFACGRLGGRDGGLGSVVTGCLMFGYAITEPHFTWEIEHQRDEVLLVVLFFGSLAASEIGVWLRRRGRVRQ